MLLPQLIDKLTPTGNVPARPVLSEGLALPRGLSSFRQVSLLLLHHEAARWTGVSAA